jgi:hypothetical protein
MVWEAQKSQVVFHSIRLIVIEVRYLPFLLGRIDGDQAKLRRSRDVLAWTRRLRIRPGGFGCDPISREKLLWLPIAVNTAKVSTK